MVMKRDFLVLGKSANQRNLKKKVFRKAIFHNAEEIIEKFRRLYTQEHRYLLTILQQANTILNNVKFWLKRALNMSRMRNKECTQNVYAVT